MQYVFSLISFFYQHMKISSTKNKTALSAEAVEYID